MSDTELILRLSTAALLIGILACNFARWQWAHACRKTGSRRQSQLNGQTIDVTPLRPRMAELRRDFSAVARAHIRNVREREERVATARREMRLLGFFRHQETEEQSQRRAA